MPRSASAVVSLSFRFSIVSMGLLPVSQCTAAETSDAHASKLPSVLLRMSAWSAWSRARCHALAIVNAAASKVGAFAPSFVNGVEVEPPQFGLFVRDHGAHGQGPPQQVAPQGRVIRGQQD
jgi:hypothetical protein